MFFDFLFIFLRRRKEFHFDEESMFFRRRTGTLLLKTVFKSRSYMFHQKCTTICHFLTKNSPIFRGEVLRPHPFYSASALVRIARNAERCNSREILSVRLSVRPSITFRCFVQTNEDTIVWFSASVSLWQDNPSSFWRGKVYIDIHRGSPPAKALK